MGRGQPVGPLLATSSDGGDIAADPAAARPVQALSPCVPFIVPVPSGLFYVGHAPDDRPRRWAGYVGGMSPARPNVAKLEVPR